MAQVLAATQGAQGKVMQEAALRADNLKMQVNIVREKEDVAKGIDFVIHYKDKPVASIKKAWAGALERAGIKRRIRPYDLRHAFATEAITAGVDIKTVAQIMGDDPKMLLEHYQHVFEWQKRDAVEALPEIVFAAKNYGSQKNKIKIPDNKLK